MAALTTERGTDERPGVERALGVAANAVIFAGAGVALNAAGYLVPASSAVGLRTIGRAEESVDNTGGANGAKTCRVRAGVFWYANSAAADEITAQDVGRTAYWVDDQTVALTDDNGARSPAGSIFAVDAIEGVAVRLGHHETLPLAAGPYAPALVGVANVDAAVLLAARYQRVGNIVHVSLEASIDPTAAAATEVRVGLPVASAIGAATDVSGVASKEGGGASGTVKGDAVNDAALLNFTAAAGAIEVWKAEFSYVVK